MGLRLDTLVTGARILTMDADHPVATRLGILGGQIVGLDDQLEGASAEKVLDASGLVVTPGFIDAHCHTAWFGLSLQAVDVSGVTTHEQLYEVLRARARTLPPNAWVTGAGLYPPGLGGQPDITRLDEATGGRPLYLRHNSGHALTANTEALRLAGVLDPVFVMPERGAIPFVDGHPIGVVDETAQELVQDLLRPYPLAQVSEALAAATERYAAEGITSFTEAGIGRGWIGHTSLEVGAYQQCLDGGGLRARAQLMPTLDSLDELGGNPSDFGGLGGRGLSLGVRSGFGSDVVSFGPTKVFMDGSLIGETAAVTEALCSATHSRGHLEGDPDEVEQRVRAAYRAGWALALHAIGDRAVDVALDLIEACVREVGHHRVPNRIEHVGITRPDQLPRLARAGLGGVTPQAPFMRPLGDQMLDLVGPERAGWLYRGRSFVDAGVRIAGSSDRPVVDGRPLAGMQQAVDRLSASGRVVGEGEQLTPYEALASYTTWAAQATGRGNRLGRLRPGFWADMVFLDADPLTAADMGRVGVVATMMDGHLTHGELPAR